MKAKNQLPISSESDAKEKLIVYVYEYLCHSGAKRAAQTFLDEISYEKEIQFNQHEPPGFLANWWCVFWDLYCAAPEKRNQPEPSIEAKVFHEHNIRTVMSPSCTQTSPHQQGSPFMGGAGGPGGRYGPHSGQLRGSPINMGHRMQTMNQGPPPPPQMGGPPPNGPPPPHPPMMGAASPRYAPHPGHMTPGSSASSVGPEPGPSPGMNRMTPASLAGSPHPQVGPPNGMGGPMSGPPPHGAGPPPPHGGPMPQGVVPMQQRGLPPQGWQGNFGSPADPQQQCFMNGPPVGGPPQQQGEFGGMTMMSDGSGMMDSKSVINNGGVPPAQQQQQQDEYILPNPYGPPVDQVGEPGSEIMKLKESLENNTKEYSDGGDQPGYNMDFPPDQQNKWN